MIDMVIIYTCRGGEGERAPKDIEEVIFAEGITKEFHSILSLIEFNMLFLLLPQNLAPIPLTLPLNLCVLLNLVGACPIPA